jgi:hypothetical protein
MMNLAKAVLQLKNEREQVRRKLEQLDSALSALAGLGGSSGKAGRVQMSGGKTQNHVTGGAETNCGSPARTLGEVESCETKQITVPTAMVPRADAASKSSEGVARR